MRQLAACFALLATLWLAPALALDTGDIAPEVKAMALDGHAFDLDALRGKVVVLNLWATWCAPCRTEMPALDAFYAKYRGRGLVVFGLSENDAADAAEVQKVMQAFSYPAALAAGASVDGIRMPRVLPITYVIDVKGVIRAKLWPGGTPVTEENLEKAVLPLLPAAN
ncbi:MAG TPA: TlpA disulfide reductase family protein [Gammaproteobacteria bacterium]|jgi:thiol-disulfide isomerase/thioredoxin|nr:TlpA disulfide reductase family protein [Gammaproteobacteria bacterium]